MQLLKQRDVLLLWIVHFAATLANELASISTVVLIFTSTGSALQATGVLLARNLPPLLLGPVVGSVVDRVPRRSLLVATDLLRALLVGMFLVAGVGASNQVWLGYALVFGLTLAEIAHKPALLASLPAVVPAGQLMQANSLIFSTTQVAFTLGYLGGGLIVASGGLTLLISLVLGGFLIAAAVATQVRVPAAHAESEAHAPFWSMAREGFAYLRDHPMARTLITVEFLESWPHGVWTSALMLTFTSQALGAGADAWGYQSGAFFAGQFLGAIMALAFARRLGRRPGWIIISNAFLMGALTLAYAASTTVFAATVISMAFGPPFALRDVAQDTLLQTTVARGMLGRIYAAREMFARMAFLVGGLIFAALADQLYIRQIYVLGGVLYCGTALYTLASVALRRSRVDTALAAEPIAEV
ncbi:MAG TPA: MFS transporter [Roseiflexaceae bacterium]|nr:MFS transporter [Roseiflexaceae bacterium]